MNRRRFTFALGTLFGGIVAVPRVLRAGTADPMQTATQAASYSINTKAALAATTMEGAIAKLGLSTMLPSTKITVALDGRPISDGHTYRGDMGRVDLSAKVDLPGIEMIAVLVSTNPFPLVYAVQGDISFALTTIRINAVWRGTSYSSDIVTIAKTSVGTVFNKRTVRFIFGNCTTGPAYDFGGVKFFEQ